MFHDTDFTKRTPTLTLACRFILTCGLVVAFGCQNVVLTGTNTDEAPLTDEVVSSQDPPAESDAPRDDPNVIMPPPTSDDASDIPSVDLNLPASEAFSLDVGFNGDGNYPTQGQACLDEIAGYGGFGTELLESLADTPINVINQPNDTANATVSGEVGTQPRPGQPITITTGTLTGNYGCDDAPKDWCAAFFHELQHADDLYRGRQFSDEAFETRGVRAENWLLAQKGLCQRNCYDSSDPSAPQFAPDHDVLWDKGPGECRLALTIINETPNDILVSALSNRVLCGNENPDFRAESESRSCTTRIDRRPSNNPYAVQLITLIAYYPSGNPEFISGGRVEWFNEAGEREACANAFSEFCQIAMGTNGEFPNPAKDHSRTIRVRYTPPSGE